MTSSLLPALFPVEGRPRVRRRRLRLRCRLLGLGLLLVPTAWVAVCDLIRRGRTISAFDRAVVRSSTRPPDAAAISSAMLMSAMTFPRPITTR